jgi:hypothetical protein
MGMSDAVIAGPEAIVVRRCPDCGYDDAALTTTPAAAVWVRHLEWVGHALAGLADALANGLPVQVSDLFETQPW